MRSKRVKGVDPDSPVWLQPEAVLGSAARYIASLSGEFDRVELKATGTRRRTMDRVVLGSMSSTASPRGSWKVEVLSAQGKLIGLIEIQSHSKSELSQVELTQVAQIARELGEKWPQD